MEVNKSDFSSAIHAKVGRVIAQIYTDIPEIPQDAKKLVSATIKVAYVTCLTSLIAEGLLSTESAVLYVEKK